jgi:PAS domain S-box-containing protein
VQSSIFPADNGKEIFYIPSITGSQSRTRRKTNLRSDGSRFDPVEIELFRSYAENADSGMGISDLDGNIIYLNRKFLDMIGIGSLEDAQNAGLRSFYFQDELKGLEKEMFLAIEREGSWKAHVRMKKIDGTPIHTQHNVFTIEVNGNKYLGNLINDISSLKEMEHELRMEKEFYRSFTESLGDWVWEMDLEGIHTYSNDAVRRILGYTAEETIGKDTTHFWLDRTLTEEQLRRHRDSLKEGKGWTNFQAVFRHKDGSSVYVLSSAVPIHDENGDLKGYRGIDRDITERVVNNARLKESTDKLNSIIETAKEVIFTSDVEGKIDFISPSVKTSLGYDPPEILGKTILDLIHPDDREPLWESGILLVKTGKDFDHFDYRLKNREGKYLWHRVTMSPKFDEAGNVTKIVGVTLDITERKKNEDRILQYNDLLRLINKILRHDLTNNIFMMKTALDHFKMVRDDKWLESVELKAERSFELIEQMRSLESILTSGGTLRAVDVQEALERLRIGFDISIEIDCPVKIMADDAFYSLIENLMRNAVIHGETRKMEFKGRYTDGSKVRLEVIDHGSGIPDNIKERIFEETFKSGKTAGTGIGLYIVKKTVERYGGSITVEDTNGGGATFILLLSGA